MRKKLKKPGKNLIDEQFKNIEQNTKQGNTKNVHELVKTRTKTKKDKLLRTETENYSQKKKKCLKDVQSNVKKTVQ